MSEQPTYPGEELGLPADGVGSLATWGARLFALLADWALAMLLALALIGRAALYGRGWQSFVIMGIFFAHKALLTALTGSSVGQVIMKIGVARVGGGRIAWWQAVVRTLLVCLVIPAVVVGANRRGLDDLVLGTVVVRRR